MMFGHHTYVVHMSLNFHCHKVDSIFLFAITAAAVVSCSDPKKSTDTSSMVQMFILVL